MKKIIVYSTPGCLYCEKVKHFLNENNVQYIECDVHVHKEKREELEKKTGRTSVPVVEIDGEFVVGFDTIKLSELLNL